MASAIMADDPVRKATTNLMRAMNKFASKAVNITDLEEVPFFISVHFKIFFFISQQCDIISIDSNLNRSSDNHQIRANLVVVCS